MSGLHLDFEDINNQTLTYIRGSLIISKDYFSVIFTYDKERYGSVFFLWGVYFTEEYWPVESTLVS